MSKESVPQGNEEFREKMKAVAQQLRKPEGEFGVKVAENMNESNKEMYDLLFQHLDLKEHDSVLEIGFGNGVFFEKYFQKQSQITAVGADFSKDMCVLAEQKNKERIQSGALSIVCSDGESLPFSSDSFDAITTLNTIYFWKNPVEYLKEIARVLKPEGAIYIGFRPMHVMKNYEFTEHGFAFFEMQHVLDLAHQARLKYYHHFERSYPKKNIIGQQINSLDICLILKK